MLAPGCFANIHNGNFYGAYADASLYRTRWDECPTPARRSCPTPTPTGFARCVGTAASPRAVLVVGQYN